MKARFFMLAVSAAIVILLATNATSAQEKVERKLWIAKFTGETKAASALAATQAGDTNALKYSNLFDNLTTFETDAKQPEGTWSLTANETEFKQGSTAERVLVGFGSGRAVIEIEYKLTNPAGQVVWTQKFRTKPSFWGSSGAMGGVQNQGVAEDEQAKKLIAALSKYFEAPPPKK